VKPWKVSVAAGICAVLSGCAASGSGDIAADAGGQPATSSPSTAGTGMTMANGQTMAPGMTMGSDASTGPSGRSTASRPSPSARMVCGDEIAHAVATLADLTPAIRGTSSWADRLFTCTYQLPSGPLVLSVKDSPNEASGRAYFSSLRSGLGPTSQLRGLQSLGLPAFESTAGIVAFLKDGKTLTVDATGLSGGVGAQQASPAEVAYEVGSDVIGCWAEDDE
jgi:hypothetical protein